MFVIPMCLSNIYEYKISVKTRHFSAKTSFPFNQGTLPVQKLTQDMHIFETKQNTVLVNLFTV